MRKWQVEAELQGTKHTLIERDHRINDLESSLADAKSALEAHAEPEEVTNVTNFASPTPDFGNPLDYTGFDDELGELDLFNLFGAPPISVESQAAILTVALMLENRAEGMATKKGVTIAEIEEYSEIVTLAHVLRAEIGPDAVIEEAATTLYEALTTAF